MAEKISAETDHSPSHAIPSGPDQKPTTASEFYSLLDEVDSEFIADQFGIGTYTNKHDFDNHLRVGVFEGINPSDSLAESAEKTATHV